MFNKYKNLTASGSVKVGQGTAVGIVINSHTSGVIKIYDSLSAAGTVIFNSITLGASERFIPLYNATFSTGMYVSMVGTVDLTIMYE